MNIYALAVGVPSSEAGEIGDMRRRNRLWPDRVLRRSVVVIVGLAVSSVPAAAPANAAAPAGVPAALTPAPGTGHGVIGNTTPAEESASLEFAPGLGAACPGKPRQVDASPLRYGSVFDGNGVVGLPVSVCIGKFPTTAIQVTITPPRGRAIKLRDQSIQKGAPGVGFDILVTASPPDVRYQITDEHGIATQGRASGDGSGTYVVRARGGAASTTTTFVLDPAPTPRLTNLTSMDPTVKPGRRLQFGAAGKQPLSTFQVAIFGPDGEDSSGNFTYPLRTTVVARADKNGEALITLDTLASCPTGEFVAVVDPQTPLADPQALDPRIAMFTVANK